MEEILTEDSYDRNCRSSLRSAENDKARVKQSQYEFEMNMNLKLRSVNNQLENRFNFFTKVMKLQSKYELNKGWFYSKILRRKLDELNAFKRLRFETEYEQHVQTLREMLSKQVAVITNYKEEIKVDDLNIFQRKCQEIKRNLLRKYNLEFDPVG